MSIKSALSNVVKLPQNFIARIMCHMAEAQNNPTIAYIMHFILFHSSLVVVIMCTYNWVAYKCRECF